MLMGMVKVWEVVKKYRNRKSNINTIISKDEYELLVKKWYGKV
jgi:hypothetical protein